MVQAVAVASAVNFDHYCIAKQGVAIFVTAECASPDRRRTRGKVIALEQLTWSRGVNTMFVNVCSAVQGIVACVRQDTFGKHHGGHKFVNEALLFVGQGLKITNPGRN